MNDPNEQPHNLGNLAIDPGRLYADIMETAAFGATAKGGICRLTLSEEDRKVRDWFKARAEGLGCRVTVDDMGNMFARMEGSRADIPPIAMGSHLDTQPTGGKFDGVLGVLSALEVLRTLRDAGYETYAPIEVINFTNEEGSRFAPALIASGVFGGVFERSYAVAQKDRGGMTFGEALENIGYRGAERCGDHPLSAYFELHIEQGPILERENCDVGVVTGAQGVRWFDATLIGQDAHTGATPMTMRRNALVGTARLIDTVDRIAKRHPPHAVATVGSIEVKPNSRNVVPGETFFTIDLRHPDNATLDAMEAEIRAAWEATIRELDLTGTLTRIWEQPPVAFDAICLDAVRSAVARTPFTSRDIVSGAGHDAVYVSRVAPSAMIFAPCKDGISHNEAEFSSLEQCGKAAQVLLLSVLEYDRQLAAIRQVSSGA
jgi:beta-ureidopropionase / N-carbamoyl-L-amino-acid hydrolase